MLQPGLLARSGNAQTVTPAPLRAALRSGLEPPGPALRNLRTIWVLPIIYVFDGAIWRLASASSTGPLTNDASLVPPNFQDSALAPCADAAQRALAAAGPPYSISLRSPLPRVWRPEDSRELGLRPYEERIEDLRISPTFYVRDVTADFRASDGARRQIVINYGVLWHRQSVQIRNWWSQGDLIPLTMTREELLETLQTLAVDLTFNAVLILHQHPN